MEPAFEEQERQDREEANRILWGPAPTAVQTASAVIPPPTSGMAVSLSRLAPTTLGALEAAIDVLDGALNGWASTLPDGLKNGADAVLRWLLTLRDPKMRAATFGDSIYGDDGPDVSHTELTSWLVERGGRSHQDTAERLLKAFRITKRKD